MTRLVYYVTLVACSLLSVDCLKVECETSLSDFKRVVYEKMFVDHTSMIRRVFARPAVKLVRAPPRFGKTIILDMIHRFLELNFNADGEPELDATKTENYKLFRENYLRICVFKKFFNRTFGKYPVIRLDYKHLKEIQDFDDMLTQLRQVLKTTFTRHEYLVRNSTLWPTAADKDLFLKYCSPAGALVLTQSEIKAGLTFLADALYRHFGRKIFVLIDDYDAVAHSLLFRDFPQTERIISFFISMNAALLTLNEMIRGAYLTGVVRIASDSLSQSGYNIEDYPFLGNHPFSEYFGISQKEVRRILNIYVKKSDERERIKHAAEDYYDGYIIQKPNKKLYNIWSFSKFMANDRTAQSYWCRSEHFDNCVNTYVIDEISDTIKHLILGKTVDLDITIPITNRVIDGFSDMLKEDNNLKVKYPNFVEWFLVYLYNFGYLSPAAGDFLNTTSRLVSVKLANQEVIHELSITLKSYFMKRFDYSTGEIGKLREAIDSFQTYEDYNDTFPVFKVLRRMFRKSNDREQLSAEDVQTLIYSSVAEKFPMSRIIDDVIAIINNHRVAILLKTIIRPSVSSANVTRFKFASEARKEIVHHSYVDYVDENFPDVQAKIFIGLCFEKTASKIGLSYSSSFIHGTDNYNIDKQPSVTNESEETRNVKEP